MARMIPNGFDDHVPQGERMAFQWFGGFPEDWVILHSLDLAPWGGSKQVEIDFVVVVPERGVVAVEVKSHEIIWRDDEGWRLGGKLDRRGPFVQAGDAQYAIIRRLQKYLPALSHVPIVRCVFFPCAGYASSHGAEFHLWELFDRDRIESLLRSGQMGNEMHALFDRNRNENPDFRELRQPLTAEQVDTLVDFLRPRLRRQPTAKLQRETERRELEAALREQQRPVLQLLENNERLLVCGPAGTGKTWIAVEAAKRMAECNARTALFCFNELCGDLLSERVGEQPGGPVAGRVLKTLLALTDIKAQPDGDPDYWNEKLPAEILRRLEDPQLLEAAQFDAMVLDEAQDLLARPNLFKCLDRLLKGGFRDGRWIIFGDFEYQVFQSAADRQEMDNRLAELVKTVRPAQLALRENCRNYAVIGNAAVNIAGLPDTTYSGFRLPTGAGSQLRMDHYSSSEQQLQLLLAEIEYWRNSKMGTGDIVVLSFHKAARSIARLLPEHGITVCELKGAGYSIACGTVHEFKGLESKVVIITDVENPGAGRLADFQRDLLYTGITRSLHGVSILISDEIYKWWLSL